MKQKKTYLDVTYRYKVEYKHPEHLENIKKELQHQPALGVIGSGVVSDGNVYGYSYNFYKSLSCKEKLK